MSCSETVGPVYDRPYSFVNRARSQTAPTAAKIKAMPFEAPAKPCGLSRESDSR
jgi:hypothetical protein